VKVVKTFVGHSFDDKDTEVVIKIKDFIESLGIKCETGERPQYSGIDEKIKNRIMNNDIFVGIFTCDKKILLDNSQFNKESFYTTSNWVIQESGFAIAKNKKLIFLIEQGIYKFPYLQGYQEYILFNRKSLDQAFTRLNYMINSLKDKMIIGAPSEMEESLKNTRKSEFESPKEKKAGIFEKIFDAIVKKEDYKKAQEIYYEELKKGSKSNELIECYAFTLRFSIKLGDPEAFSKLKVLVNENKNNFGVVEQLALVYKEMGEYRKAKNIFSETRKLLDTTEEKDKEKIIDCYEKESLYLVLDNEYEESIKLLSDLLYEDNFKEYKAKILAGLANLAKIKEDIERFFIYAEGSLNMDPTNTELRFDLAYRYSKKGDNEMSLLHYKRLINTTKSPDGLNNLGVQYDILKLPAKSIDSYLESSKNKNTLAMANIAGRYLNEGFIKDAKREIKRAYDLSRENIEAHGNIGYAKNRMAEILEKEEKKEKEILIKTERERKFRVKYSEAFYCDIDLNKEKFDGVWSTSWGDVKINFDKDRNSFTGSGKKKIPPDKLLLTLLKNQKGFDIDFVINRSISIQGNITKLSGKYEIIISEKDEYADGISYGEKKSYKITGYMVINKDINKIEVMEKKNDEDFKIYSWKKVI
jgi:tetratricopeptide (TPR) repeat protein